MTGIIEHIKYETRDVKWIRDQFQANLLKVDETFQRRFVWAEKHQVQFIETILEGFPAPEIYLWQGKPDDETGETHYSIVDGQQRVKSVVLFIENEFALDKKHITPAYKSRTYVGKKFSQLTGPQKQKIWGYQFSVKFIGSRVSRPPIISMFLRLNRTNMTLNPQELRHAEFEGQFLITAEEVSKQDIWEKIGVFKKSDLRRMLDIQFISNILIYLRKGIATELNQTTLNDIYDLFNDEYAEADQDKKAILRMARHALSIADKDSESRKFIQSKVHLYALMIVADRLKGLTNKHNLHNYSAKFQEFVRCYHDPKSSKNATLIKVADEYKQVTVEGVQKKYNRTRRVELLYHWLADAKLAIPPAERVRTDDPAEELAVD